MSVVGSNDDATTDTGGVPPLGDGGGCIVAVQQPPVSALRPAPADRSRVPRGVGRLDAGRSGAAISTAPRHLGGRLPALLGALAVAVVLADAALAGAATYYVGPFTACGGGACNAAANTSTCGAAPNPCADLSYWQSTRKGVLANGDRVYFTGTHIGAGTCIVGTAAINVTYEGRNADDTAPTDCPGACTSAVLDASLSSGNPCNGSGIWRGNSGSGQSFQGATFRTFRIQNAVGGGIIIAPKDSLAAGSGGTIDRVRVTGSNSYGVWIGPAYDEDLCKTSAAGSSAYVTDWLVQDSQFDRNGTYGLWLACVGNSASGQTIVRRNASFLNCDFAKSSNSCSACVQGTSCVSDDGMHIVAKGSADKYVLIEANEVYENGEDGIDVSGNGGKLCDAPSSFVRVQRNRVHDNGRKMNLIVNHCNHDVDFWTNFVWGAGGGLEGYECPWNVRVYNNTFFMTGGTGIRFWEGAVQWAVINNAVRTASSNEFNAPLTLERASTNTTHHFENNVLVAASGGVAVAANNGVAPSTTGCTASAEGFVCPACPAANGDGINDQHPCDNGVACPSPDAQVGFPFASSEAGRGAFLTQCGAGTMFATSSCTGGSWGTAPAFLDTGTLNAANLHLQSGDTVAKEKGQDLSTIFVLDYDEQTRPINALWDIGADEQGTSTGATPAPTATPSATATPTPTRTATPTVTPTPTFDAPQATPTGAFPGVECAGCALSGGKL